MEKHQFLLIVLINLMLLQHKCMSNPDINTDKAALLAFRDHITNDPSRLLSGNWSENSSVCNWVGITCTAQHNRVASLDLSYMSLTGTVPSHLGNLSFLSTLNLRNNSFFGPLPNKLSQLRRLKYINIMFNNFNETIPSWFGFLPKLETIAFSHNSFTGPILATICNSISLRVIDLSENQLSGSIPFDLFNIPSLTIIDVSNNMLSGVIPTTVSNMSSLVIIDVGNNNLRGGLYLENICNQFSELTGLYASGNELSGLLPSDLSGCKKLQFLSLSYNGFTGNIPREIGNLTMLTELFLGENNLSGTIPNEMGKLGNLELLAIQSANLSGLVPLEIFNITTLKSMLLADNKFSGSLPNSIGATLPNLEKLVIGMNQFYGNIPISIANASNLFYLDLALNSFSGYIPYSLGYLTSLEWLNLYGNSLTIGSSFSDLITSLTNCKYLRYLSFSGNPLNATFPPNIGNLSQYLEGLLMENCSMKGQIPHSVGKLTSLTVLSFERNDLTGSIPSTFGRLKNLQGMSLSLNRLNGSIPNELCQLQSLGYFYLFKNEFSGTIPACLGDLISLRDISLAINKLSSTIPFTFWNLVYILSINMSSNSLTGPLSSDVGKLTVLNELDLSNNQLSGFIPSSLASQRDLVNLSLAHNMFEGMIPESFGNLISLEYMDLSQNSLVGVIPKSLEALVHLKYLNLSFNKLQGEIPNGGPFGNFSENSFLGNDGLCGGDPNMDVPPCISVTGSSRKWKTKKLMVKYVVPVIASIILLLAIVLVLTRRQKKKARSQKEVDLTPLGTLRKISYLELQQATNRFSEINLLGEGSFGSVYKGTLSDGTIVAVKVFNLNMERAAESFDSECEVMVKIRHRNLVKVISSCSNVEDFKALVLEYMPNGSLEQWLYANNHFLDLQQRMNIMTDVAIALEYLHFGCSPIIVHCDLKPCNVLLDGDMVAHVADFGIAKIISGSESLTQTINAATIGYMAPEYGIGGIVSRKGDVYSYGILLMETLTKKKPTDEMFDGERNMREWVRESYLDAVDEVVDAYLLMSDDPHNLVAEKECLSSLMALALDCCAEFPEERLDMRSVVSKLHHIKLKFRAK